MKTRRSSISTFVVLAICPVFTASVFCSGADAAELRIESEPSPFYHYHFKERRPLTLDVSRIAVFQEPIGNGGGAAELVKLEALGILRSVKHIESPSHIGIVAKLASGLRKAVTT